MDGPMPDMPTPTCDWGLFPQLELPKVEARHFSDEHGDDLFVRNLYEVRRMQYTIYNALGKEPSAWRDGKPLATAQLTTPAEYEAYTAKFWPWDETQLNDLVHSRPNNRYYIDAWDVYHDGIFHLSRTSQRRSKSFESSRFQKCRTTNYGNSRKGYNHEIFI